MRILVELLDSQDPKTKEAANHTLEEIGLEVIPEIKRAIETAEPRIRAAGREAIERILLNEQVLQRIRAQESHELIRARRGALGAPDIVVGLVGAGVDRSIPDIEAALIGEENHIQDSGEPHIAATMSARLIVGDPDSEIVGVAPGVRLLSERVLSAQGVGELETIAEGIHHASVTGAKIIYADLGGLVNDERMRQAAEEAQTAGCLIVAPAGNESSEVEHFPAALDGVLAVAATDAEDRKTHYSSYGGWVDLSAPGSPVEPGNSGSTGVFAMTGTTFSGALVAGTAALVWSMNPSMTNEDVKEILLESADDIDGVNPTFEGKLGIGRINVLRAVQSVLGPGSATP